MKIPSIITNESLESLYDGLDTEEVNLPRTFKKLRLGLLPRISQFFITLLKHHSATPIKFYQLEVHDNEPGRVGMIFMPTKIHKPKINDNGIIRMTWWAKKACPPYMK